MNVQEIARTTYEIQRSPEILHMTEWFRYGGPQDEPRHYCGCLAGNTVVRFWGLTETIQVVERKGQDSIPWLAMQQLELTVEQTCRLFFMHYWPERFRQAFENGEWEEDRAMMATAVAMRAMHFIRTGGTDGAIAKNIEPGSLKYHKLFFLQTQQKMEGYQRG